MNKVIYTERKSFLKYDESRYIVYLNEEVIEDYVPQTIGGIEQPSGSEPVTAYAYTGPEVDGGTLIDALSSDRDSLINGIIRSKYSQSEEDAIKTHQIISLTTPDCPKAEEYAEEWKVFNSERETAIATVDGWFK
jgi:hypothetical protein